MQTNADYAYLLNRTDEERTLDEAARYCNEQIRMMAEENYLYTIHQMRDMMNALAAKILPPIIEEKFGLSQRDHWIGISEGLDPTDGKYKAKATVNKVFVPHLEPIIIRERMGPMVIHPDAIARADFGERIVRQINEGTTTEIGRARIATGTITAQHIIAGEERTFTMRAYDMRGDRDGDY